MKIFPGHGSDSTLKKEREENQFVQMMFEERYCATRTRDKAEFTKHRIMRDKR